MWPFSTPKPVPAPQAAPPEPEPEATVERLARLEREFLQLQTEWADTLDKIGRHFSRAAARDRQRLHRDLESAAGGDAAPELAEGAESPTAHGNGHGQAKAALRAAVNARRLRGAG